MALSPGDSAPDFTLSTKTAEGPKHVTLSEVLKDRAVVLLFFPMAFTSVCTNEMCSLNDGLDFYTGANVEVFGISGDSPFALEAWAQKENLKITLLSDYEHKVAGAYDVAYDSFLPQINLGMGGVAKRSAFVIDCSGKIVYAESSDDAKQLPDFEAIKAKVGSL